MIEPLAPGEIALVGGGPGDPSLLTLAAWELLQQADVILHDRLGPVDILESLPQHPELINVGKIPRGAFTPQEIINQQLIEHAIAGRKVVRLKGGDSFVFGRGGEEWIACAARGLKVRVVPGVTSAVAAPALGGIPVTHRGITQGFTVVSGHVPPEDPRGSVDWRALAKTNTTIVLLMAVKYFQEIANELVDAGMDPTTPVAIIEEGSLPGQQRTNTSLSTVSEILSSIRPPSVIVIGEVALLQMS